MVKLKRLVLYTITFLSISVVVTSCKSDLTDNWKEVSLLKYNVPLTIKLPDGAEFKENDFGIIKDLSIVGPDNFHLQIMASDALSSDLKKMISEKKLEARRHRYFSKFLEEYEDGFIFEKQIEDHYKSYDFRYIKISGNTEMVFQMGLMGRFSEDEVKNMYKLCKKAK